MNAIKSLFFGLLIISFVSCKDSNGKSIFEPNRIEPPKLEDRERLLNRENVGRSPWQQPDLVVNKLTTNATFKQDKHRITRT